MLVDEFDYLLPEELIAQVPCEPRDHSRLMVLERDTDTISHQHFYDLLTYLDAGDTLVFNDTKVMPARLIGKKAETGAKIEVFLLHRVETDVWAVLVKPGKRVQVGCVIEFSDKLRGEILNTTDFGGRQIRFFYQGVFEEILDELGETPLPPYIKQKLADKNRYQTIYAREQGSAAAPTAGLHFTPELLENIQKKGIQLAFITLHVGLGTFRPVAADRVKDHKMHKEHYFISEHAANLINTTKLAGKRVIAVGTTSVRTLESAQKNGVLEACSGWTDIFIFPGYQFQLVDRMITNFHLPKSTLLMLISAFAGKTKIMKAYQQAIESQYRFFSFGDAMLIL